jgi:thiamine biosynthesis lipoprotein
MIDSSNPNFLTGENLLRHPNLHRFSHGAMATVFEAFLFHDDRTYANQAAVEAFRIADAVEQELSRFAPNGDVGRINRAATGDAVRVGTHALECLSLGLELQKRTRGAFDLTAGALKDRWLRSNGGMQNAGMEQAKEPPDVEPPPFMVDRDTHTVRLLRPATLDLGAIGKGYAVDRMAESLHEWDIATALVHGGRSSVFAYGSVPGRSGWPVAIRHPEDRARELGCFDLNGRGMGASGLEKGPHIVHPGTGRPVEPGRAVWAFAPDAATADAVSTAFMVMTLEEIRSFCLEHVEILAVLATKGRGVEAGEVLAFGAIGLDGIGMRHTDPEVP